LRNKRLFLSVLTAALLALVFWTQSRVPALNEKAQMGLRTQFNEIAFETIMPVAAEQGFAERVLRSSVNWAYTNWKGMTFGLLFAAAALLILSSLRRRSFENPWLNTIFGAAAGAPLGVCVNCATPIAQGIYMSGARLETALAALIASPTLNVIVLTMSFAILPWEIAAAKLVGVVAMLAMLPLLVSRFCNAAADTGPGIHAASIAGMMPAPGARASETYAAAASGVARDFMRHLRYIVKLAVPLMLLAGVLGAIVVEVVPFDYFAARPASISLIVLAAVVATLLPVPIAFDVIVVSALLAAGADVGLATAVLFALGVFSIYPALVIAKEISVRLSAAMACMVAAIAVALAFATQGFSAAGIQAQRLIIAQGLTEGARDAYAAAMTVCESLPDSLHEQCFAEQIEKFSPYIEASNLCATRPSSLDARSCDNLVEASAVLRAAIEALDITQCRRLEDSSARSDCEFSIQLQRALNVHDVEQCSTPGDSETTTRCRAQYISSSLLFNPDDSVCRNLAGGELADCRINARVYRLAEALDFNGCSAFRAAEQREFCRYVIASSMIGRHNDPSGCAQLSSPDFLERCRSQALAWQAERERSVEQCARVSHSAIRSACQLRVAGLRIDTLLSAATTTSRIDHPGPPATELPGEAADPATAPELTWRSLLVAEGLEVRAAPLAPRSRQGDRQFRRVQSADLGIDDPWNFRITDFFEPFMYGKGIASGDFNNDAWPDLVFASDSGIVVYQNTGGRFAPAPIAQGELADKNTFLVAFVDANNDEYPDIFASSYGGANFLLLNSAGDFANARLIELPGERRLTLAAGFGDLNADGAIDIVHGNWTSGVERLFSPEESGNEILFSDADQYRVVRLEEVAGETLSVLLSDIDFDDDLDVLVANDRIVPDMHYLNRGNGEFDMIEPGDGIVPVSSMFTMSLESADFNNDLIPDLFSTDMTFSRSSRDAYCDGLIDESDKALCESLLEAYNGLRSRSALVCSELESRTMRQDCFTAFALQAAKNLKDSKYCELADATNAVTSLCHHLASAVPSEEPIDQSDYVRQVQRNTLLIGTGEGFVERAESFGVASSFWSWNAKAADLDNDGWLDIYVGNGFHFGDNFYEIQENVLYHNVGGVAFEEQAAEWGLNDTLNTPAYTYVDIDRDGDLDIVATGVLAPPRVYVNEEDGLHSLVIRLLDERGNSRAIGAVVTIGYGAAEALRQRRTIKLSGGFMSFDEPLAHFGLGAHSTVDWVEVRWPDGEVSRIEQQIPAHTMVEIRRTAANP
jgi:uncharacterized membrane protein YraQ (UPF0718 family)